MLLQIDPFQMSDVLFLRLVLEKIFPKPIMDVALATFVPNSGSPRSSKTEEKATAGAVNVEADPPRSGCAF